MNRYSRKREYSKPTSPYDMNFIGQAMAYKQSRIDANEALVQDTIDNIMSLQIDKPEARDYLYKKVEGLVNQVNSLKGVDLSSNNIARNISSYINNAMDTTVLNAYAGTMEGRKLEQYYDQLMMNDPEKYNERNKAFALAPYYKWLSDGNAGSRLAPLQVSNYVDYKAEAQDVLKQMREANKNGMEWQYPDPNNQGYMITKKIDRMTPDEVEQAVYNSISSGAKKQMYIDGWYMANTQPELFTPQSLNQYVTNVNGDFDQRKAALRAQMAGAKGDPERYKDLQRSYSILDERRSSFNNQARQIFSSGNIDQMGAFMVEHNFVRGMAQTWAYDKSSMKMENDTSYWNKMNYQRNLDKDQIDASLKRAELTLKKADLDIKRENAVLDAAYKRSQIALNAARVNQLTGNNAGNGLNGVGVDTNIIVDNLGNIASSEQIIQTRLATAQKEKDESVVSLMNELPKERREEVNAWIATQRSSDDPKYKGLSDNDMVVAYLDNNGGFSNDMLSNGSAMDFYSRVKESEFKMEKPLQVIREYDDYQKTLLGNDFDNASFNYLANSNATVIDRTTGQPRRFNQNENPSDAAANALGEYFLDNVLDVTITMNDPSDEYEDYRVVPGGLPIRGKNVIDKEKVNSPTMISLLKTISDKTGDGNVTVDDIFMEDANGDYVVRPYQEGEPYTVTMFRGLQDKVLDYRQSTSLGSAIGAEIGNVVSAAFPLAGLVGSVIGGKMGGRSSFLKDKELLDTMKSATDPGKFSEIVENNDEVIQTPLGKTVSKDAKENSPARTLYTKLKDMYVTIGEAEQYGNALSKFAKAKITPPNTMTLTEVAGEKGVSYGIYMNGDRSTMVPVDAATLIRNDINVNAAVMTDIKDLKLHQKEVSLGSDSNTTYSKYVTTVTGVNGISSKYEIMNTMYDTNGDIFFQSSDDDGGQQTLTKIGEEAAALAQGVDKFVVGINGFQANGTKGLRVYLYDKNTPEASRTPVYQYDIDDIRYADQAMKWLEVCPQYFVLEAYNRTLNKYRGGKMRGNEAGKDDWNTLLGVVVKK